MNPIVNTTIQLPNSGILNYTSINIPTGVTLNFAKNTTNTPVTLLVSGDVTIEGSMTVSGGHSADAGAAGDGNVGDDGIAGIAGPGGFDGGQGGDIDAIGGSGLGPGGAAPSDHKCTHPSFEAFNNGAGAGGGGFATQGAQASAISNRCAPSPAQGGNNYGNNKLLPIIGGSGGGGAHGGLVFKGSGGGGGIRIIATTISGNGTITAIGGSASGDVTYTNGGNGSAGRIRLEAETMLRTAATNPAYVFSDPQPVFVAGLPGLRIISVAGSNAPANPTGNADIVLPESTPNPVEVIFATSNIPLGNTVTLTVTPATGNRTNIISDAINGTETTGTASASIDLPLGPSTLSAEVSYTVTASLGQDLSRFAQGEQVERVRIAATLQGQSMTTLITVAGNEYTWPSNKISIN